MQWTYQGIIVDEIPEGIIGFVYLITNLTTGRKYIGKKRKRKTTVESDWRDYWGSSESLQADVATLGPEQFTREIIYYCKSRSELSYLEAKEQFDRCVLETDDYYNGIINVRVGGSVSLRQALQERKAK